jgi:hypothetical protein
VKLRSYRHRGRDGTGMVDITAGAVRLREFAGDMTELPYGRVSSGPLPDAHGGAVLSGRGHWITIEPAPPAATF